MSEWQNPNPWDDYPEKKPEEKPPWNPLDDFVMPPRNNEENGKDE